MENNQCEINSTTKITCRACRFEKCVQVGMSIEGCFDSKLFRRSSYSKREIFSFSIYFSFKNRSTIKSLQAEVFFQFPENLTKFNSCLYRFASVFGKYKMVQQRWRLLMILLELQLWRNDVKRKQKNEKVTDDIRIDLRLPKI